MKILYLFCVVGILGFWSSCTESIQSPAHSRQSSVISFQNLYFPYLQVYSDFSPEVVEIDSMFEQFRRQWLIKGLSVAMVKDGKLVYAKGFGYADEENQEKVKPYHLFRIASVSKLFTAVGIMKLVEEGKLKLEDKVFGKEGILTEYTEIADPMVFKITIEHLLTHTAGWRNQLRTDPMFVPVQIAQIMKVPSPPSLHTTIQFMLSQKGYFEPGTLYDYSNFGYCLLGKIIEKKTGLAYETFMQEKILYPLQITRMKIAKNRKKDKFPNEVTYYAHPDQMKNLSIYGTGDSVSRVYEGSNTEALGAAGGWVASSIDLMRFLVAIDGFESKKDMLNHATIQKMTTSLPQDTTGKLTIGWKAISPEKWWRTGSLASTGISLTRRNDGISWVMITNTGSWRGPFFSYEIEGVMQRAVAKIKHFPDWDLFLLN